MVISTRTGKRSAYTEAILRGLGIGQPMTQAQKEQLQKEREEFKQALCTERTRTRRLNRRGGRMPVYGQPPTTLRVCRDLINQTEINPCNYKDVKRMKHLTSSKAGAGAPDRKPNCNFLRRIK